jgi:hypothetical protein
MSDFKIGNLVYYRTNLGKSYDTLTEGKAYQIRGELYNLIRLLDDKGVIRWFHKCAFEEVDIEDLKPKFSDKRQFNSGAQRDSNEDKIRPDLISPYMLKALGKVMAEGAKHYGERNWEKGMPQEVFMESASRHYVSWMNGEVDEDHASKLIFNVMAWIHFRDSK